MSCLKDITGTLCVFSIIVILCHLLHYLHKKCIQLHNCLSSITHTMYIWFSLSLSLPHCVKWRHGKEVCGSSLDFVWWGLGQIFDYATEQGVVRNVVLVPEGSCRRENARIELLPKVASLSQLRPYVPHASIVKCQEDSCKGFGKHLDCVPAYSVKKIVVLSAIWSPPPRLNTVINKHIK